MAKMTPDEISEINPNSPAVRARRRSRLEGGRYERPSSRVIAPPVGYKRQPSMFDNIRETLRKASREAEQAGYESEEEADDFEIGDDFEKEPIGQGEIDAVQAEHRAVLREADKRIEAEKRVASQRKEDPIRDPQDPSSSKSQNPGRGAVGGSPTTPPTEPRSAYTRVTEHFRRRPEPERNDD